jgi:hypothetical protein
MKFFASSTGISQIVLPMSMIFLVAIFLLSLKFRKIFPTDGAPPVQ